jgi:ABC-type dipeptide/oligopeptide/nickel transport system permease subunit
MEGEAYLDIVWKQFKKNRLAFYTLWVVLLLFLVAIVAPALASNQPFTFREGNRTYHPWWNALLNPESTVDFLFNSGLVILPPWIALSLMFCRRAMRRGVPARRRTLWTVAFFFILLLAGAGVLSAARPANRFFDRDFKKDQFEGKGSGSFALLAYGPQEQDLDIIFKPPLFRKSVGRARYRDDEPHWLGTDDSGRDVLTRLLYGSRISLTVGFVAVSIYVSIGIVLGALAGYFGGAVDMVISRIIEIVTVFPSFFLILTLVALLGPSIYIIMIVIGITGWPTIARLIRGEFLRQRSIDYVAAAQALGASSLRVMFRHILPNALSPAFVAVPFGIAGAIVTEAGLSVLGFGVRPPTPSWGAILNLATSNYELWWLTLFASIAIFFNVAIFNLVGNGLRDAMDPRLKGTQ